MAIDSAEKRRSIVGIWTSFMPVGVTPNVSRDVEWRQESGWGYPGIAPSSETPPEPDIRRTRVLRVRLGCGLTGM